MLLFICCIDVYIVELISVTVNFFFHIIHSKPHQSFFLKKKKRLKFEIFCFVPKKRLTFNVERG